MPRRSTKETPSILGEGPITSFFKVIPTSQKRKGQREPTTSLKRRKEDQVRSSRNSASNSEGKGKRRDSTESPYNEAHTEGPDNLELSNTPESSKTRYETALQTPPATHEIPSRISRRRAAIEASTSPSTSKLTNPPPKTKRSAPFIPTPSTNPRPKTRFTSASLYHSSIQTPSKTTRLRPSTALLTNPLPIPPKNSCSDFSMELEVVPSSQSQEDSEIVKLSPKRNQSTISARLNEARDPHSVDYGMTVESSQSQFLSPSIDLSPRRRRPDADNLASSSRPWDSSITIPSSQKQENEMEMLPKGAVSCYENTAHRFRSSGWSYLDIRIPATGIGTLSDQLSSTSIQTSVLVGNFHAEGDLEAERKNMPPSNDVSEGSVTEFETEDESYSDRFSNHPRVRIENQQFRPPPYDPPCKVYYGDLQDRESLPSQNASGSLEEPSSSSPLPSVLQEFRDMFGSSDESYPPDFPMSLRS